MELEEDNKKPYKVSTKLTSLFINPFLTAWFVHMSLQTLAVANNWNILKLSSYMYELKWVQFWMQLNFEVEPNAQTRM